jgi:hypothetical protein
LEIHKPKDPMLAGLGAGHERRPGYRGKSIYVRLFLWLITYILKCAIAP